ncbi:MAG: flavodoxin family protein [Bacteroidales bacterium]|nr:flavodoxin family protein [Bacteroidales bacterium]
MKVLLINGSPRKEGNTFTALEQITKQLSTHGIDSEIIWIGNRPVRGCIACNTCIDKPGTCAFSDDLCNTISSKMQDSDALVVGSPVYYGQPNGALLSLLQRALYSAGAAFVGKPAAAVAVCRRGGASAAFQTLTMPFQMMSMPVISSQYWNIAYGRAAGEAVLDTEGMQTMRTMADNLAALLEATEGKPAPGRTEPWAPMHFIR